MVLLITDGVLTAVSAPALALIRPCSQWIS